MIQVNLGGSDTRVANYLRTRMAPITESLRRRIDEINIRLQTHIKQDKLMGQVLTSRHGDTGLAGSIRVLPTEVKGDVMTGGVQGGGGTAFYGRFHEYGTSDWYIILPKEARALAFTVGGMSIRKRAGQRNLGFGEQVVVRRVIHPPIRERSFMRSALNDYRGFIRTEIVSAIRNGISPAGTVGAPAQGELYGE
jgi:hypothetical protein